MSGGQTRLDGTTLVIRTPMRFQRRGGRKRIVAPDGSEIAPTSNPRPEVSRILWLGLLASDVLAWMIRGSRADEPAL